mmetsp:Transcript_11624/g.14693  ORF Transcript_11624/g.14693 Transcript_11624/m.14693 type:complete len:98 (+) Transcript_11624:1908-2201(+)
MAIMSPLRTQALLIKNLVQEKRKNDLGKKISKFGTIGSFEDFVSRRFSTIIVSLVRTRNFDNAGTLFNQAKLIEFLLSRVQADEEKGEPGKIIIISK